MGTIITGAGIPQPLIDALEAIGAPKHLISLDLRIRAKEPVEITCTFHPTMPDGSPEYDGEKYVEATKRYRLVAVEDEA